MKGVPFHAYDLKQLLIQYSHYDFFLTPKRLLDTEECSIWNVFQLVAIEKAKG